MILVLLFLVTILAVFFGIKSYQFAKIILKTQDAIEESLDLLDERYRNLTEILQKPVFFDSIEVRQVIDEITVTRDSILFIANQLEEAKRAEPDGKKDSQEKESS
jgi:hypothetical protein